jgi:hypothetical protein
MVEEEVAADLGTGMDVDGSQESGEVVDEPGSEIELALPKPMRDAVQAQGPNAGVEDNIPAGTRRRIA